MFSEMVEWAVDEGADILIGETFYYAEEAYTALDIIQKVFLIHLSKMRTCAIYWKI